MYIGISGGLILLFLLLFRFEGKAGRRMVLPGLRAFLDKKVLQAQHLINRIGVYIGAGTIRMTFHYLMHKFLALLIYFIKAMESYFHRLQKRNRIIARTVQQTQAKTHLDLIADHKESVSLTEGQKKKLKDKSLSGT